MTTENAPIALIGLLSVEQIRAHATLNDQVSARIVHDLLDEVSELRCHISEVEQYAVLLREFVQHKDDCSALEGRGFPCDCGLRAALAKNTSHADKAEISVPLVNAMTRNSSFNNTKEKS